MSNARLSRDSYFPVFVMSFVIGTMSLGGCAAGTPAESGGISSSMETSASEKAPSDAPTSRRSSTDDREFVTTDDRLAMVVAFDRTTVEPGESIHMTVTIRNERAGPVVVGTAGCQVPALMHAVLPIPTDPEGRSWDGIRGEFKRFALTQGFREGGAPVGDPGWVLGTDDGCGDAIGYVADASLDPGRSVAGSVTWTAAITPGIPALTGDVPFTVQVGHDPVGGPPSYPPGYKGPLANWFPTYEELTVTGTIHIVGDAPKLLSVGQAIDAILGDRKFVDWMSAKPSATWSGVNVFLTNSNHAEGVVPEGPLWEVDLFRERGVPRNFAIGFLDAYTGAVRGLNFCNEPCNR